MASAILLLMPFVVSRRIPNNLQFSALSLILCKLLFPNFKTHMLSYI